MAVAPGRQREGVLGRKGHLVLLACREVTWRVWGMVVQLVLRQRMEERKRCGGWEFWKGFVEMLNAFHKRLQTIRNFLFHR